MPSSAHWQFPLQWGSAFYQLPAYSAFSYFHSAVSPLYCSLPSTECSEFVPREQLLPEQVLIRPQVGFKYAAKSKVVYAGSKCVFRSSVRLSKHKMMAGKEDYVWNSHFRNRTPKINAYIFFLFSFEMSFGRFVCVFCNRINK